MAYNKLTARDLDFLRTAAAPERVTAGSDIGEDYWHDELGGVSRRPEAMVRALSTEEVSKILAYANDRRIPVVARGSGTGLVGGCVSVAGGILLDLTGMDRILELDRDNLTVTVQPGVLLMELAAFAEDNGFLYPPDPGEKSATIGGNISTNAGGMRAVKYGVTRDYVRGLTAVLADGTVLHLGGKVVKNSTGYALKDLIVGSEGTLAVITEAILKLVPKPLVSVSLLIPFDTMDQALDTVPEIVRSQAAPTAIEYMARETILFAEDYLGKRFPDDTHAAYLLLTFDGGSQEQVEREYGAVADLCQSMGALDALIVDTEERKNSVWPARGAFLEAIKASTTEMDECDVVVPRSAIAEFIKFSHQLSAELGLRIPSFGHAGDGNLHLYLCRDGLDQDAWASARDAAFDRMYARAAELGGLVSGEHGVGYAKRRYMAELYGPEQLALMGRIKAAFDPNGILNPYKVWQAGE